MAAELGLSWSGPGQQRRLVGRLGLVETLESTDRDPARGTHRPATTTDLPTDGRGRTIQTPTDLADAEARVTQPRDLVALLSTQIPAGFLYALTDHPANLGPPRQDRGLRHAQLGRHFPRQQTLSQQRENLVPNPQRMRHQHLPHEQVLRQSREPETGMPAYSTGMPAYSTGNASPVNGNASPLNGNASPLNGSGGSDPAFEPDPVEPVRGGDELPGVDGPEPREVDDHQQQERAGDRRSPEPPLVGGAGSTDHRPHAEHDGQHREGDDRDRVVGEDRPVV